MAAVTSFSTSGSSATVTVTLNGSAFDFTNVRDLHKFNKELQRVISSVKR